MSLLLPLPKKPSPPLTDALVGPGDHVIVEAPCYESAFSARSKYRRNCLSVAA